MLGLDESVPDDMMHSGQLPWRGGHDQHLLEAFYGGLGAIDEYIAEEPGLISKERCASFVSRLEKERAEAVLLPELGFQTQLALRSVMLQRVALPLRRG